ncbi:MAG TPA: PHP domain-containing protein [bacterium]|nr:PHP domain-containing protein [bacterium]HOL47984.1 PHP domain-containing protein [bacterium]HPQ19204.1 PHP domain-containing protein [bacterium]
MNTEIKVDFHLHSYYSDGSFSPEEIVSIAKTNNYKIISITDHDTLDAYKNGLLKKVDGIQIISGIEMSADLDGKEYHILGYNLNINDEKLLNILTKIKEARKNRVIEIIKKLNEIGIKIKLSDLKYNSNSTLGRFHIAKSLVELRYANETQEVFAKYLNINKPCYVPHYSISPFDIIKLLKNNGAIIIWAHPFFSNDNNIIKEFVKIGLDGIETYHIQHNEETKRYYSELAKKYNLLETGGSDWHGDASYNWNFKLKYNPFIQLCQKLKEI